MGDVVHFPYPARKLPHDEEIRFEAATEWLVTEVELSGHCGVRIDLLRAHAEKELQRPRSSLHKIWAETFLRETEQYR